jgi:CRP-like cAMP-binding protein
MRGRVKVSAVTDDGREALFSLAGPGDLVGEISALAGRQRTATVRALEPVSSLAITGDALRAAVSRSSRLAIFFLELAGWTAVSREAVNRAPHQLRAVGCLRSGRRRMIVTDLDALRRYAGVSGHAR